VGWLRGHQLDDGGARDAAGAGAALAAAGGGGAPRDVVGERVASWEVGRGGATGRVVVVVWG